MADRSKRMRATKRLTLHEACERLDKRFSHVEDNTFMSQLKSWVKEILKEKGC